MRAIFGVLSLLVALAIVGSLAKKNLQAFGGGGLTVPEQTKALQDKVRDDTVHALQQGAERANQRADQN